MFKNFGGLTKKFSQYKTAKIAVLPIEFDKSVSWLSGAAKGPKAILAASAQVELYDIETDSEVYKYGIFTAKPIQTKSSLNMISQAYAATYKLLKDKKFVISLGGDHSVTLGPLKAHCDYYKDVSILHLDAHADRRDSYHGNKFSHASIMARASEITTKIVSVGIRSMDISEKWTLKKGQTFLAQEIYDNEHTWINKVLKKLGKNVYLSLDVDIFDSGIMPATGTPEPGGLNFYHVIKLLKRMCQNKNLIGLDVVELAPIKNNPAPDFLVAKLIYKILSYKFCSKF